MLTPFPTIFANVLSPRHPALRSLQGPDVGAIRHLPLRIQPNGQGTVFHARHFIRR
jgi:hypothetical protein